MYAMHTPLSHLSITYFLCYTMYAINFIAFIGVCAIQSVRLYDASANVLRGEFRHAGPVLDCCFHDDSSGFSVAADNTVRRSYSYSTLKLQTCLRLFSFCLDLT